MLLVRHAVSTQEVPSLLTDAYMLVWITFYINCSRRFCSCFPKLEPLEVHEAPPLLYVLSTSLRPGSQASEM